MPCVFGPVPSRRLGLSLGVDLIPPKTCTYDCLYCQVGRTTELSVEPQAYVSVTQVAAEIKKKLITTVPDVITLAGSGEPTLHSKIHRVIDAIKEITAIDVVLLTNGSILFKNDVRSRVMGADIIMPTLTSAIAATFNRIHRPHPALCLDKVMEGLKKLRNDYEKKLYLEVVLLAGINDTEKELKALKKAINEISPDKIHLNTVVRPPSDFSAESLDMKKLREILTFFGKKAEIVVSSPVPKGTTEKSAPADSLLEMVKRRPLKTEDMASALGLSPEEVEDLVHGLLLKGKIRKQEHSGNIYYLSKDNMPTSFE